MTIDPGAQAVLDLIKESGRPPFHELTTEEAREAFAASRAALQPDPIELAEVHDPFARRRTRRRWRARSGPRASCRP